MSGFEIAGVVLGAFPLIIEAAKEFRPGLKGAKAWWRFDKSFKILLYGVRSQEIAYIQVLERLVEHLDLSSAEHTLLTTVPDASLWYDPAIKEGLELRFPGEKYRWVMDCLVELHDCLLELQKFLPVGKVRSFVHAHARRLGPNAANSYHMARSIISIRLAWRARYTVSERVSAAAKTVSSPASPRSMMTFTPSSTGCRRHRYSCRRDRRSPSGSYRDGRRSYTTA